MIDRRSIELVRSNRGNPMELRTPRTFSGPWAEAHELAKADLEPVFVPIKPFADDRGWSFMNLFAGAMTNQGQVNFSVQYPGGQRWSLRPWEFHPFLCPTA